MKNPHLVVMAAGMGSRYGGLKQIDPVDSEGHIIIDYSIHDAMKAGFKNITFIIKKAIEKDFREVIDPHLAGKDVTVRYVFQELDKLPELQYEILSASANYLKSGGKLLYSTCTLLEEENLGVVERFLENNPGFHKKEFTLGDKRYEDGVLTFVPHLHKTDGFFVSLLEKD